MPNKQNAPIIIKRVEEDAHEGHHGGGWKVAYADFMTAMMAFFLLLWILAASDEEKLRGLANYFTPTVSETGKAAGDGSDLRPMVSPGALLDGGPADGGRAGPSFGEGSPLRVFDSRMRDTPPDVVVEYLPSSEDPANPAAQMLDESNRRTEQEQAEAEARERAEAAAEERLDQMRTEILERLEQADLPEELAASVKLSRDGNGMIVEVVDVERRSLFARGRSDIRPDARALILAIGESLADEDGAVQIIGHTDATQFGDGSGYSNWELSADRANVARRLLIEAGVDVTQIGGVSGVAATQPANLADPFAAENRRISIRISNVVN